MARPRKRKTLVAWMDARPVGRWEQAANGEHRFHYAQDWLRDPEACPVSLSLPLRSGAPFRGTAVETWRGHLRTDGDGDCFGAVQLLPDGQEPAAPATRVLEHSADAATIGNAWLCGRIVAAFGLAVAHAEFGRRDGRAAMTVARFDRDHASDGSSLRLHHEPVCQALGIPAVRKYEADGGPGARAIMALLLGSRCAEHDRLQFLQSLVVAWLLAATNMHARHVTLAIEPQGRFRLALLHGHRSAWPTIGQARARMAMAAIGDGPRHGWDEIQPRHWLATAQACGYAPAAMRHVLESLVAATPCVVADAEARMPAGFPESVGSPILRGIERSARRLEHWLTRS